MPRHFTTADIVCWRVSQHCNRSCFFCLSLSSPTAPKSYRDPVPVIDRLHALGVKKISYSGGEPLEYPYLGAAIDRAAQLGIAQVLTTNGDRLLAAQPDWLTSLEYLKLSFYGDKALHDQYMRSGHYNSQLKLARKVSSKGTLVGANYMLTPSSAKLISSFLADCLEAGFHNIMFQTYISNRRPKIDKRLSIKGSAEIINLVERLCLPYRGCFAGGVKLHDYDKSDWLIILTPENTFTIPSSSSEPDFIMGRLNDSSLTVLDGSTLPAREALRSVWNTRHKTPAIVAFD